MMFLTVFVSFGVYDFLSGDAVYLKYLNLYGVAVLRTPPNDPPPLKLSHFDV